MLQNKRKLDKSIEVQAYNRPIKIAYLVSVENVAENHLILDAVFAESYTRWSGVRTLIVPVSKSEFLHVEYQDWLKFYDPDFIYSYVDVDDTFLIQLTQITSPVAFLQHKKQPVESDTDRRSFSPAFRYYFSAVPSVTTIHSLLNNRTLFEDVREDVAHVLMCSDRGSSERFVSDNFGAQLNLDSTLYRVPGLYDSVCLLADGKQSGRFAEENCFKSKAEILGALAGDKIIPISKLAMLHSKAIPRTEPHKWANSFHIFVGETCTDRIHFWNARNLIPDYINYPGTLIINVEEFNDNDFLVKLGMFLNNHNYLGSGQHYTTIRSYSVDKETLVNIRDLLSTNTYNGVYVRDDYNEAALPELNKIGDNVYITNEDSIKYKVEDDINTVDACEPDHYSRSNPRYNYIYQGQWMVELAIQRHNSHSKYSNVNDIWLLPRRKHVAKSFSDNKSRINRHNMIALIPESEKQLFTDLTKITYRYTLKLPDDMTIFYSLVAGDMHPNKDDVRTRVPSNTYGSIRISDKGQNLRGVIQMFDSLHDSYCYLTNRYWREVIRNVSLIRQKKNKERSPVEHKIESQADDEDLLNEYELVERPGESIVTLQILNNALPAHTDKERINKTLRIKSAKQTRKYLEEDLLDSLEYLISIKAFFQVYEWRCVYCGHANIKSFDLMAIENHCEVCGELHYAPVDLNWSFKLNDFIKNALCINNGLTVLWALGYLHERNARNSFYYIPEVDLYPDRDGPDGKKEIDILCVIDGVYYACEVKRSSAIFYGDEKDKNIESFVNIMNKLAPDVALLVFEEVYGGGEKNQELSDMKASIREKLNGNINLEVLVASTIVEFKEYEVSIGRYGDRVRKFFDALDRKDAARK